MTEVVEPVTGEMSAVTERMTPGMAETPAQVEVEALPEKEDVRLSEPVPGSPVRTVSSLRSSVTRRKPVPPPKDETTLPSWITQVKKPRRRPVSVASVPLLRPGFYDEVFVDICVSIL